MTSGFSVKTTPRYERLARTLYKGHPEFITIQNRVIGILVADPYNRNKIHHIKKLEAVSLGDGHWRLSLGRFRFRYDIYGKEVILHYCGLRREDTYR